MAAQNRGLEAAAPHTSYVSGAMSSKNEDGLGGNAAVAALLIGAVISYFLWPVAALAAAAEGGSKAWGADCKNNCVLAKCRSHNYIL
jgi:hypothetical protein